MMRFPGAVDCTFNRLSYPCVGVVGQLVRMPANDSDVQTSVILGCQACHLISHTHELISANFSSPNIRNSASINEVQ